MFLLSFYFAYKPLIRHKVLACAGLLFSMLAGTSSQMRGQFYELHNIDLGAGITGQYSASLPFSASDSLSASSPSFAPVVDFRYHPHSWIGLDIAYHQTATSEVNAEPTAAVHFKEVSATYLMHSHSRNLQPFIGIGGGALFSSTGTDQTDIKTAGVLDAGFDIPLANPHLGLSAEARGLFYKQAASYTSAMAEGWKVLAEPSVRVYVRF